MSLDRAENMSRAVKYICERSIILFSRRAVDDVRLTAEAVRGIGATEAVR
jgi:hypothetical protein